ncbi:MAG: FAD-binding oxidoreductase [Anaerolineae bacterium]|nr:FAD-binding oxidoreductase [Anaerolineae bacterium]
MTTIHLSNPIISLWTPLEQLRAQVQGGVYTPEDDGYENARKAWNLTVDQHPAVIVTANNAAHVAATVRFARATGRGIAVQSTGHGVVLPANDSVLIRTSSMQEVRIDPVTQTAWVEAGALWHMVLTPAQKHGLAPLLGSSPYVGVVGYTLGGGMGWLSRKYGLAADSVRSFELVTPEGQLINASSAEHSDLFWALRGGGGNFGVITGMEIQLYPVTTVYGGNLIYPAEIAKQVFTLYREWIASAPDELTSSIAIMNMPNAPALPEPLRGKSVVMIKGCFCGSVKDGEALLAFWRSRLTPIADSFQAMPFSAVGTISNDPVNPSAGLSSGGWLKDLSDETIDAIIQYALARNGSPLTGVDIRHAGGAIARVAKTSAAFSHRTAPYVMQMFGGASTSEAKTKLTDYIAGFKAALAPHLDGVYLNFLSGEEARARSKEGYSEAAYQQLKGVKAVYDPNNYFRHSFDIPAGS